jgi:hypothetical protein
MTELDKLSPRDFESLVATILTSFGWEVSLTPATRDGGVDIVGVSKDGSGLETTWAVECKYFSPRRKVGVETVRHLIGVRQMLGFDKAVLVTSTDLTPDARWAVTQATGVHFVDRTVLLDWIRRYDRADRVDARTPDRFASCFVSHSSSDADFTARLVGRLRSAGVRVWYAPEELSPGQKIVDQIDAAIGTFDKLLVVLSDASLESNWVKTEIRKAFHRQREEAKQVVFPVSLIPFEKLRKWELIDSDSGEDLAHELRSFFVPDFSDWKDDAKFDAQFVRLLSGLRGKPEGGSPPAAPLGEAAVQTTELNPEELSVLVEVAGEPDGLHPEDAADLLPMHAARIQHHMESLETLGLLEPIDNAATGRRWYLSRKGRAELVKRNLI